MWEGLTCCKAGEKWAQRALLSLPKLHLTVPNPRGQAKALPSSEAATVKNDKPETRQV